jgi:hypothetical protein
MSRTLTAPHRSGQGHMRFFSAEVLELRRCVAAVHTACASALASLASTTRDLLLPAAAAEALAACGAELRRIREQGGVRPTTRL